MKINVIDDIFGTEKEVRNIVQKNLPEYIIQGQVQPQLYLVVSNQESNEATLYLLKPLPYDKHHRAKEVIKTTYLNPKAKDKKKERENYLQREQVNKYQNVA